MASGFLTAAFLSMLRHILTMAGGFLVAKGWISAEMTEQIIGAVLSVLAIIWGAGDKAGTVGIATVLRGWADKLDPQAQ